MGDDTEIARLEAKMDEPIQFAVTRTKLGWKIIVQSEKEIIRVHEPKHFFDAQEIIDKEFKQLKARA